AGRAPPAHRRARRQPLPRRPDPPGGQGVGRAAEGGGPGRLTGPTAPPRLPLGAGPSLEGVAAADCGPAPKGRRGGAAGPVSPGPLCEALAHEVPAQVAFEVAEDLGVDARCEAVQEGGERLAAGGKLEGLRGTPGGPAG